MLLRGIDKPAVKSGKNVNLIVDIAKIDGRLVDLARRDATAVPLVHRAALASWSAAAR
jgi:hypothetical protein